MMDIEKLIEQLRYLADTPSYTAFHDAKEREIICDQCEADFCYDKQQDAHWCMYEALSRASTALSTLRAENEKLRAELEQVKAERDAAVESIPHECKTCVYHTVFFNGCTPDHDCTNPDGGCSNNCDRWKWRDSMTNAEKALQYFIIAVPENKEQAEAYVWARRALNVAIRSYRETYNLLSAIEKQEMIARAESAEARAEKAEKERDAAIEDMRGICYLCANAKPYSALSRTVMTCAHKEYTASTKYPECKYFKWRGQKEE